MYDRPLEMLTDETPVMSVGGMSSNHAFYKASRGQHYVVDKITRRTHTNLVETRKTGWLGENS